MRYLHIVNLPDHDYEQKKPLFSQASVACMCAPSKTHASALGAPHTSSATNYSLLYKVDFLQFWYGMNKLHLEILTHAKRACNLEQIK